MSSPADKPKEWAFVDPDSAGSSGRWVSVALLGGRRPVFEQRPQFLHERVDVFERPQSKRADDRVVLDEAQQRRVAARRVHAVRVFLLKNDTRPEARPAECPRGGRTGEACTNAPATQSPKQ